jgi:hypothetical protein
MDEDSHKFDGRTFEMVDESGKPEPNVIKSSNSDYEDNEETLLNNHPDMLHRFPRPDPRKNEEFKEVTKDPTNIREIHANEFGINVKSKRDLHNILTIE